MKNRLLMFGERGKRTTMMLEFCFLCDYVDVTDRGLLNIYGGAIHRLSFTKLPEERPLMLAMSIEYDPIEDSGFHRLEARVIDGNSRDSMCPEIVETSFPRDKRFYGMDIKLHPFFSRYGEHSVEVSVDGHHLTSIPLNVIVDK